jgi:hypothetical protein
VLPHASSLQSYDRLVAIAKDLATPKPFARQQELVEYVDMRFQRENIVVPRNLARVPPFVRYGQSTNNVCEQFNSAVLEARAQPLGLCVDDIIALTSKWRLEHSQSAVARGLKAAASPEQLRLHVTPATVERIEMLIAKCNEYKVVFTELNANQLTAQVTHIEHKTHHSVKLANGDGAAAPMCCATAMDRAMPCGHMVAAIMAVPNKDAAPWSPFNLLFFGAVWHTTTWEQQLGPLAVPFDVADQSLLRDEEVRPWARPPQV